MPGRRPACVLLLLMLSLALALPAVAAARASFNQLENEFMCVACHESLAVAQSPEAFSERQYIRDLIAQGETGAQIKRDMVEQYGQAVLAVPPASGFNLVVYVLPAVVVGAAIIILAFTVPKWRRRSRTATPAATPAPLNPDDARRLNDDLGRYA